jgi:hypothetical protein
LCVDKLKGPCHEIGDLCFFLHQSTPDKPLILALYVSNPRRYCEYLLIILSTNNSALCRIAHKHDFALCRIAQNSDCALSRLADKQHIIANISANSKRNSKTNESGAEGALIDEKTEDYNILTRFLRIFISGGLLQNPRIENLVTVFKFCRIYDPTPLYLIVKDF